MEGKEVVHDGMKDSNGESTLCSAEGPQCIEGWVPRGRAYEGRRAEI